jgi:hypothetical protein
VTLDELGKVKHSVRIALDSTRYVLRIRLDSPESPVQFIIAWYIAECCAVPWTGVAGDVADASPSKLQNNAIGCLTFAMRSR